MVHCQIYMQREILIQLQLYSIEKPKVDNRILHSPASDNTRQIVEGSILSQLVRSRASVLRHGIARGWSSHEEGEKAIMLMISLRSTDDNSRINGRFSEWRFSEVWIIMTLALKMSWRVAITLSCNLCLGLLWGKSWWHSQTERELIFDNVPPSCANIVLTQRHHLLSPALSWFLLSGGHLWIPLVTLPSFVELPSTSWTIAYVGCHNIVTAIASFQIPQKRQIKAQGCIFRLTCSHPELIEDHVLTSAYVKICRTVTRNAVNKSVWRNFLDFP